MSAFEADRFNQLTHLSATEQLDCSVRSFAGAQDLGSGLVRPLSASTFEADRFNQLTHLSARQEMLVCSQCTKHRRKLATGGDNEGN